MVGGRASSIAAAAATFSTGAISSIGATSCAETVTTASWTRSGSDADSSICAGAGSAVTGSAVTSAELIASAVGQRKIPAAVAFETKPQPPGLALYEKWLKKSGGAQNENSVYGWLNADLLVAGLKAAGPNFTQKKVVDAINSLKTYNAGGLVPNIDWTTAHKQQPACYAISKIVNGGYKPVFGQPGKPFLCFPANLTTIPANPQTSG